MLAASGTDVKTLQTLARHGGPVWTLGDLCVPISRTPFRRSRKAARPRRPVIGAWGDQSDRHLSRCFGRLTTGAEMRGTKSGLNTGKIRDLVALAGRFSDTCCHNEKTQENKGRPRFLGAIRRRRRWDSNPRITDLQSVPLVHLGTPPQARRAALLIRAARLTGAPTRQGHLPPALKREQVGYL